MNDTANRRFVTLGIGATLFSIFYGAWWASLVIQAERAVSASGSEQLAKEFYSWVAYESSFFIIITVTLMISYIVALSCLLHLQEPRTLLWFARHLPAVILAIGMAYYSSRFLQHTQSDFQVQSCVITHGRFILDGWLILSVVVVGLEWVVCRVDRFLTARKAGRDESST
jgi:predicted neutral ceramidase superfamily lipid hydrolase